jgi:hypothetical protein
MKRVYSLRTDAYAHILPRKYKDALYKISLKRVSPPNHRCSPTPLEYDLDQRFRVMGGYDGLV